MDAIVAVYDDWGIGCEGDQPVALSADRKFFRRMTAGSTVIVGRKTVASFPGQQPLPKRRNIVLTRQDIEIPGAEVVHTVEEAVSAAEAHERCLVIGGASVYRQMFPNIDRVLVTQIDLTPVSDSFFPNLDEDHAWTLTDASPWREEDGVRYRFCEYKRI